MLRVSLALPIAVAEWATTTTSTAAELRVPSDYPTIQAAVDASSNGDTIHIAPGIYPAQVKIISKKLAIKGQPGTILRATKEMKHFSEGAGGGPGHIPVMFAYLSEVSVRNVTFEGEHLAGEFTGDGDTLGLYFLRSTGDVENCTFYGFRESTPGPRYAGSLWFLSSGADHVTARVAGCTFADNYESIFLRSEDAIGQNITATIENNTIIGPGPVGTGANFAGIGIAAGVGGVVRGNTIEGYSYVNGPSLFPMLWGILAADGPPFLPLSPLVIENNTLRDNQLHITLLKADNSVVRNNRIQGTAPGLEPVGILASGENVTIAENQLENTPEGIRLLGKNPLPIAFPDFGDGLGFAVDARVTGNRFCNVAIPVNVQTSATATVQDTKVDACSSRPLAIESAVLLSWPGDEEGWTVEWATSLNGPWTASPATVFLQNQRHSVSVPSAAESRFYRLR